MLFGVQKGTLTKSLQRNGNLRQKSGRVGVLDFIDTFYTSLNAPLWAVIGCPLGLIIALHFASDKNADIQGARVDSVVREARLNGTQGRSWIKSLGFFIAFGYGLICFVYILDRNILFDLIDRLMSFSFADTQMKGSV
jgi:hypothetical protein